MQVVCLLTFRPKQELTHFHQLLITTAGGKQACHEPYNPQLPWVSTVDPYKHCCAYFIIFILLLFLFFKFQILYSDLDLSQHSIRFPFFLYFTRFHENLSYFLRYPAEKHTNTPMLVKTTHWYFHRFFLLHSMRKERCPSHFSFLFGLGIHLSVQRMEYLSYVSG